MSASAEGYAVAPAQIAVEPPDLPRLETQWLAMLADAEAFIRAQAPDELGCLCYHPVSRGFVAPMPGSAIPRAAVVCHYGRPGGVLPTLSGADAPDLRGRNEPQTDHQHSLTAQDRLASSWALGFGSRESVSGGVWPGG